MCEVGGEGVKFGDQVMNDSGVGRREYGRTSMFQRGLYGADEQRRIQCEANRKWYSTLEGADEKGQ